MIAGDTGVGPHPLPLNRIVLLGASNLTLSLNTVVELVQGQCGNPSDVLIAAGHGRSYGQYSQVMIRGLLGITTCGLWDYLEHAGDLPTYALLTDIGNDIPYGHRPEDLLTWVEMCVERLQHRTPHVVLTNLQLDLIASLSDTRFRIIRSIFFPSSRISRPELLERAAFVHNALRDLATRRQLTLCEQDSSWFGPDAMHLLYWKRKRAYRSFVERFPRVRASVTATTATERHAVRRKRARFAYKKVLGREWRAPQPSGLRVDGSTVSMY